VNAERGVGVTFDDLRRGAASFLMDVGLGSTAEPGAMFATRLIAVGDVVMTGGAALPVTPAALRRIEAELKRDFGPVYGDLRRLPPMHESEFVALVIQECLADWPTAQVRSAAVGSKEQARLLSAHAAKPRDALRQIAGATATVRARDGSVGRNTRCTCGSGRKYKYCCGRN
jgi:hypothetical protein